MKNTSDLLAAITEMRNRNTVSENIRAWIDESGEKGLVRRLSGEKDNDFGIVCAVCVPAEYEDEIRSEIRPYFESAQALLAENSKNHITDGFSQSSETASRFEGIRRGLYEYILSRELAIVYEARRLRVARESFRLSQKQQDELRASQSDRYAFPNHVDQDRLEVQMTVGLAFKLDLFSYIHGANYLDMYFDNVDANIFNEIEMELKKRTTNRRSVVAKGFDLVESKPVKKVWSWEVGVKGLPSTFLTFRSAQIVRPVDERIFTVDVIANSLRHHLSGLPATDHLNIKAATRGWILHDRVWAPPTPGIEDFV